jgi:hypothetical protein
MAIVAKASPDMGFITNLRTTSAGQELVANNKLEPKPFRACAPAKTAEIIRDLVIQRGNRWSSLAVPFAYRGRHYGGPTDDEIHGGPRRARQAVLPLTELLVNGALLDRTCN